jgi:hypothetical protein
MDEEAETRLMRIEQLSKLLTVVQDLARKLADESHGRSYDKVRELNELLHLARQQLTSIQLDADVGAPSGIERRRMPRSQFGDLR